jgi:amidase
MMAQAPISDTAGWFARDAATFARVSEVMFGEPIPTRMPSRLVVAVDAFGIADEETAAALQPIVRRLSALVGETREEVMAREGSPSRARSPRPSGTGRR